VILSKIQSTWLTVAATCQPPKNSRPPHPEKSADYSLENGPPLLKECAGTTVHSTFQSTKRARIAADDGQAIGTHDRVASFAQTSPPRKSQRRPPPLRGLALVQTSMTIHFADSTDRQRPIPRQFFPDAAVVEAAKRGVLSAPIDFSARTTRTIEKLHTPRRNSL
jgi:hypothetical protein